MGTGRRRRPAGSFAALVALWAVAAVVVLVVALSAFLGRVDWGDGGGASLSDAGLAIHLLIIAAILAAAGWATRALRRH